MKVALVEFLNAYPLYYALKEKIIYNNFHFLSYPPSVCAKLLREKRVDIGNVPVIEYAKSDSYKILTDCCISSNREVKSVVILLKKPIEKIRRVKLDKNSNTSVTLTKILFRFKYGLSVDYVYEGDADCELVIGDNALKRIKDTQNEKIDLAVEWHNMTSLPFVFAVWVAISDIDESTKNLFIQSKEWGKKNIDTVCKKFSLNSTLIDYRGCKDYLTKNISYDLTEEKIEAIKLFFYYASKCGIINSNPELTFI